MTGSIHLEFFYFSIFDCFFWATKRGGAVSEETPNPVCSGNIIYKKFHMSESQLSTYL